jgi:hypothetical protein
VQEQRKKRTYSSSIHGYQQWIFPFQYSQIRYHFDLQRTFNKRYGMAKLKHDSKNASRGRNTIVNTVNHQLLRSNYRTLRRIYRHEHYMTLGVTFIGADDILLMVKHPCSSHKVSQSTVKAE